MIAEIKMVSAYKNFEKTIQNPIHCVGVGVHGGQKARLTLKPAPVGTGIVFKRVDITDKDNLVPAVYSNVVDTRLCSCIGNKAGVTVSTVEHLMAAFAGFGITNIYAEIDGPEVPIMDGSSQDFVTLIKCAGIMPQNAPLKAIKVLKEVTYDNQKGDTATLLPAEEGLEVNFMVEYPKAKIIGRQEYSIKLSERTFTEFVAYARTFSLLEDVEMMRSLGLIKGGSLDNAVVVDNDKVLNPEGLRSENEFVVHKTLDAIGDLWQAGMPIIGIYSGVRKGHSNTNMLLRQLMADKTAYEIVEVDEYLDSLLPKKLAKSA
ncbi:MAG: UDP-3-O-acyl-N-acetylglucosamine deacetylase [Lactobacillales bacterium]|jgi:UDP-3-O-[3-hydroxymyristoyl] N-acetylglucosamine deacetylase|nr:UDP-3-O-acyl-N-acetylglucosamine deacetylase [Lactobacillales bacterium]